MFIKYVYIYMYANVHLTRHYCTQDQYTCAHGHDFIIILSNRGVRDRNGILKLYENVRVSGKPYSVQYQKSQLGKPERFQDPVPIWCDSSHPVSNDGIRGFPGSRTPLLSTIRSGLDLSKDQYFAFSLNMSILVHVHKNICLFKKRDSLLLRSFGRVDRCQKVSYKVPSWGDIYL